MGAPPAVGNLDLPDYLCRLLSCNVECDISGGEIRLSCQSDHDSSPFPKHFVFYTCFNLVLFHQAAFIKIIANGTYGNLSPYGMMFICFSWWLQMEKPRCGREFGETMDFG